MMTDASGVGTVPVHGLRIVLRDPVPADLEILRYWLEPDHRWQELDAPYYPKPSSAETDTFIERLRARIIAGEFPLPRISLIVADAITDTVLGRVSWSWESEETNWLSVGIVIYDPQTWGRGLGYEALGLWCDYVFTALPEIVRLDLRTWSGNHGMMALATKLGFQEEARFRRARIVRGEYFDGMGYGILREEWRERYPNGFAAAIVPLVD